MAKKTSKARSARSRAKPVRDKEIEKIARIEEKKEMEIKKEIEKQSRGIPFLYAVIIFIIIAVIGAFLIFSAPETAVVKKGDLVLVRYTGELQDGTTFDSGNFTFNAGMGQAISGFDLAVLGMAEGETKRIEIPPEDAYGEYNPDLIMDLPLTQEFNITLETTLEVFNLTFGEPPVIDRTYRVEGMEWPIRVVNIQDSNVTLRQEVEDGQLLYLSYGTSVVNIVGDTMIITLTPRIGGVVTTILGNGRITSENGTHMTLDFNHELAGKNLIFTVTVLKVLSA
ncbi:MAG: hypothetical protein GTN38_02415 [Candidatus Aenigmarchaeota archaeon]|nr:hypothetical protein [Candidatus Aenigmarchaeota archaeon]NIP40405.1 hypothetical protein [Candidatus Aenigmarchaeota archaeon]NIQ18331.1 hypothetical protein [Candidatus Aenigmarchaeota archaeon]NIS73283.1 hypothetical protein [Candidatus Aenigmarchaeota archaeon]